MSFYWRSFTELEQLIFLGISCLANHLFSSVQNNLA
nr:MAG TPA: hypothetical protein [Caudoviricetes sp.]